MRKTHGNRAAALIGFCLLFTACKAREGAARASALDRVPHEERTNNFDNGQKKETFSVVKDEHGNYVKDGSYMLYHQNGQKAEEGAFKAGGRDGHWQHWADDGKLTSSTNYLADKREGAFTEYEDGRQIKSGTYKNDELDGTYTYSASEKFTVSGAMSHGKPSGPWVITETSGKVRARAKFESAVCWAPSKALARTVPCALRSSTRAAPDLLATRSARFTGQRSYSTY